jgi:hypothetical protein
MENDNLPEKILNRIAFLTIFFVNIIHVLSQKSNSKSISVKISINFKLISAYFTYKPFKTKRLCQASDCWENSAKMFKYSFSLHNSKFYLIYQVKVRFKFYIYSEYFFFLISTSAFLFHQNVVSL